MPDRVTTAKLAAVLTKQAPSFMDKLTINHWIDQNFQIGDESTYLVWQEVSERVPVGNYGDMLTTARLNMFVELTREKYMAKKAKQVQQELDLVPERNWQADFDRVFDANHELDECDFWIFFNWATLQHKIPNKEAFDLWKQTAEGGSAAVTKDRLTAYKKAIEGVWLEKLERSGGQDNVDELTTPATADTVDTQTTETVSASTETDEKASETTTEPVADAEASPVADTTIVEVAPDASIDEVFGEGTESESEGTEPPDLYTQSVFDEFKEDVAPVAIEDHSFLSEEEREFLRQQDGDYIEFINSLDMEDQIETIRADMAGIYSPSSVVQGEVVDEVPAVQERYLPEKRVVSEDGEVLDALEYFKIIGLQEVQIKDVDGVSIQRVTRPGEFHITDDASADWFIGLIRRLQSEIDDILACAANMVAERARAIVGLMWHYGPELRAWAEPQLRVKNGKVEKNLKRMVGTLFWRKIGGPKKVDGKALKEWAKSLTPDECTFWGIEYEPNVRVKRIYERLKENPKLKAPPGIDIQPEDELGIMGIGVTRSAWSFAKAKKTLSAKLSAIKITQSDDSDDDDGEEAA